jgi:hypothetical protein
MMENTQHNNSFYTPCKCLRRGNAKLSRRERPRSKAEDTRILDLGTRAEKEAQNHKHNTAKRDTRMLSGR